MTCEEFTKSLNEEQREFLKVQLQLMLDAIRFHILLVESLKGEDNFESLKRDVLENIKVAKVYYELLGENEFRQKYVDCVTKYTELQKQGVDAMNILLMPCWDEYVGGEAYNVILGTEENKIKNISTSLHFDENTVYDVMVWDGVLTLTKIDFEYDSEMKLIDEGVVSKEDVQESISVLQQFGGKFRELKKSIEEKAREERKRKDKWLHSNSIEIEVDWW